VSRNITDIWTEVLEGDPDAWEELVLRYAPFVYTICRRCGLSEADAQDCSQQTWMALYTGRHRVKNPLKLPGWLMRTASRKARRMRLRAVSDIKRHQYLKNDMTVELPDEHIIQIQRNAQLELALEQLDERCRRLLTAIFFSPANESYRDVAQTLKVAVNSMGPMRSRCLKKLKQILSDMGYE
jgi:RNA polymerase sigma factor (sigma-70 family)